MSRRILLLALFGFLPLATFISGHQAMSLQLNEPVAVISDIGPPAPPFLPDEVSTISPV